MSAEVRAECGNCRGQRVFFVDQSGRGICANCGWVEFFAGKVTALPAPGHRVSLAHLAAASQECPGCGKVTRAEKRKASADARQAAYLAERELYEKRWQESRALYEMTVHELAAHLPDGPWIWRGQRDSVHLCTDHSGQYFLMGVTRMGMSGAQFAFQSFGRPKNPREGMMSSGLLRGHQQGLYLARAYYDLHSIHHINHPLAHLIQRIPEMVARIAELEIPATTVYLVFRRDVELQGVFTSLEKADQWVNGQYEDGEDCTGQGYTIISERLDPRCL